MFVATKSKFSFVATKLSFVETSKHVFVTTKHLSRQKLYLWQLPPMIIMRLCMFHLLTIIAYIYHIKCFPSWFIHLHFPQWWSSKIMWCITTVNYIFTFEWVDGLCCSALIWPLSHGWPRVDCQQSIINQPKSSSELSLCWTRRFWVRHLRHGCLPLVKIFSTVGAPRLHRIIRFITESS